METLIKKYLHDDWVHYCPRFLHKKIKYWGVTREMSNDHHLEQELLIHLQLL